MKRHEDIMKKQFTIIDNHINSLVLEVDKVRISTANNMYVTSSALAAHIIISSLRRIQNTLIDVIADINQGHFDTHLLSPEQLEKQLNIISGRLQRDLMLPSGISDIKSLYKLLKVSSRVTNQYLIIEIKVPIMSNEIFELDKIITIPQKRGADYYYIIPTFPYIGFNINKDVLILNLAINTVTLKNKKILHLNFESVFFIRLFIVFSHFGANT
jgi:hypothetical protein